MRPGDRPIRPSRLAAHALRLANHHTKQGRPIVTWLRRSTSASYYALFHAVALAVAEQVAPAASDDTRYRFSRSMEHKRIAEVCRWIDGHGSGDGKEHVRPIVQQLRTNADLVDLAEIFLRLQQARHEADYDHLALFRKASTLTHHQQAVRAIALLRQLKSTPDGQEFLALVALNTSLR